LEKLGLFLLDDWKRRNNMSDTMDIVDEQDGFMYVMKDFLPLMRVRQEGETSDEGAE
jgi:hypothetical protein